MKSKKFMLSSSAVSAFLFVAVVSIMRIMHSAPLMTSSWATFKNSMKNFFESGLGGPGMEGIGIAIAVIGVVCAAISFVVHKFNPQSRMPGWVMCLTIGLVGAIAMGGVGKPIQLLVQARDTIFGWFGL